MTGTENSISIEIIGILSAIIAAISGAVAGGIIGRKNAIRLAKEQEFRLACQTFRSTFTEIRVELDEVDRTNKAVYNILQPNRIKLKEATFTFQQVLDRNQWDDLERAWITFSGEDYEKKGHPKPLYQYNIHYGAPGQSQPQIRDTAVKNIKALLKFANYESKR